MMTYLLKIVRPVMVSGVMKTVGEKIELVEHEAIKLVEAGKAEFTALEEKVEEVLGLEGSKTPAPAAPAEAPAPAAATEAPAPSPETDPAPAPAAPAEAPAPAATTETPAPADSNKDAAQ